jgi:hypothetical protein
MPYIRWDDNNDFYIFKNINGFITIVLPYYDKGGEKRTFKHTGESFDETRSTVLEKVEYLKQQGWKTTDEYMSKLKHRLSQNVR